MIRILHTIDTTGPGGAETVFIDLVKGLDPKKFESIVAIRGPGWVCDTLRKNDIEPLFVQSRGGYNFGYLRALVKIVRDHRINVIQSHLLGANLYSSMAGLICRVPVISTLHGFVDVSEKERFIWIKGCIIKMGSKKFVFVSDRLREYYVEKLCFPEKKSITIYNGVDTSVFYPNKDDSIRKELGLGPEHVLIGALGNIRPAKGYDLFLKAARIVCDKHQACRFVLAGQGEGKMYEELLCLRKELNLEKKFFFIGFRNDAAKVLNNLNIFVLPSVSEGFSISTIEAMACGVSVVVTRCGGPEEFIENDKNGLLVDLVNPEKIALSIEKIYKDSQLAFSLAEAGRRYSQEKFSIQTMVTGYQKLYQECCIQNNIGAY